MDYLRHLLVLNNHLLQDRTLNQIRNHQELEPEFKNSNHLNLKYHKILELSRFLNVKNNQTYFFKNYHRQFNI